MFCLFLYKFMSSKAPDISNFDIGMTYNEIEYWYIMSGTFMMELSLFIFYIRLNLQIE